MPSFAVTSDRTILSPLPSPAPPKVSLPLPEVQLLSLGDNLVSNRPAEGIDKIPTSSHPACTSTPRPLAPPTTPGDAVGEANADGPKQQIIDGPRVPSAEDRVKLLESSADCPTPAHNQFSF
jgi:hypothetical protein